VASASMIKNGYGGRGGAPLRQTSNSTCRSSTRVLREVYGSPWPHSSEPVKETCGIDSVSKLNLFSTEPKTRGILVQIILALSTRNILDSLCLRTVCMRNYPCVM
jgi:hypothetical protein